LEDLVARLDENGDGLIDFEEFCKLCENNCVDSLEKMKIDDEDGDLKEAFDVFDKDKDGLISVEELGSVLCSMGLREGAKMEDCKEMIKKIDVDGDGMVSFYEFKSMMRNGGSLVSVF
jgi:Ca2+-binding EF-hand superfamily protein